MELSTDGLTLLEVNGQIPMGSPNLSAYQYHH